MKTQKAKQRELNGLVWRNDACTLSSELRVALSALAASHRGYIGRMEGEEVSPEVLDLVERRLAVIRKGWQQQALEKISEAKAQGFAEGKCVVASANPSAHALEDAEARGFDRGRRQTDDEARKWKALAEAYMPTALMEEGSWAHYASLKHTLSKEPPRHHQRYVRTLLLLPPATGITILVSFKAALHLLRDLVKEGNRGSCAGLSTASLMRAKSPSFC